MDKKIEKKIVSCTIEERKWDCAIWVTDEDGLTEIIRCYYPDEIVFSEHEFIGLTKREAKNLCHQRDLEYLRR